MEKVSSDGMLAIVYARYNSNRLPGKVLFEIGGDTILGRCVRKLKEVDGLRIVIATSNVQSDDPIVDWAAKSSVDVFRGDLDNVALRTKQCLQEFDCEAFFRVNADSPFLQPSLVNIAKSRYQGNPSSDIVSNILERTYPYGIAVELVKTSTFLKFVGQFNAQESEHITSFFYKYADQFKIESLKLGEDLSKYRFVLDTPEDWSDLQRLYDFDKRIFDYNIADLIRTKGKLHEEHLFNPSKGI